MYIEKGDHRNDGVEPPLNRRRVLFLWRGDFSMSFLASSTADY